MKFLRVPLRDFAPSRFPFRRLRTSRDVVSAACNAMADQVEAVLVLIQIVKEPMPARQFRTGAVWRGGGADPIQLYLFVKYKWGTGDLLPRGLRKGGSCVIRRSPVGGYFEF